MKKIVARNVGIIVGLSVLFSAVVTGCGNSGTSVAGSTTTTSSTSVSAAVSASTEASVEEVTPPVLMKSYVSYYADGSLYESEEYDRDGNVTKIGDCIVSSLKDESGNTVVTKYIEDGYTDVKIYSPDGLLLKEIDPWGSEIEYTYDDKGNLIELFSPFDGVVTYTYDSKNRMTCEEYVGTGSYIDYKYESDGTRVGSYYDGEKLVYTESVKYNDNGDLLFIQKDESIQADDSWDGKEHYASKKSTYTYDSNGKILEIKEETFDEDSHTYLTSGIETYEYDEKGNGTLKTEKYGDVEYQTRYENEYDEEGRLSSVATYADEVLSLTTYYSYFKEY